MSGSFDLTAKVKLAVCLESVHVDLFTLVFIKLSITIYHNSCQNFFYQIPNVTWKDLEYTKAQVVIYPNTGLYEMSAKCSLTLFPST